MAGEPKFGAENTEDHVGLRIETSQLSLGKGTKTASATAGAATLNQPSGIVTTESLTTAAAGTYTLTLTNSKVAATDLVQVTLGAGSNSAGVPVLLTATCTDSTITVKVYNAHASAAFNGTLTVQYNLLKV